MAADFNNPATALPVAPRNDRGGKPEAKSFLNIVVSIPGIGNVQVAAPLDVEIDERVELDVSDITIASANVNPATPKTSKADAWKAYLASKQKA